jgi:hypothetical protein
VIEAGNEKTGTGIGTETETAIRGAGVAGRAVHPDTLAQTQDDLVCGINTRSCPHGTTIITDRRDYGRDRDEDRRDRDSRDTRRRDDRDRDRRDSGRRDGEKKERDRHDKDKRDGERARDGEREPLREGESNVRTDSEPRETGKPTQSQGLSSGLHLTDLRC